MKLKNLCLLLVVIFQTACAQKKEILYVGTYSQRESQGLYIYEFDREGFAFKLLQTMPEITSPNFLAVHPTGKFLYSVNLAPGPDGSNLDVISAFAINTENGTLSFINQIPSYGKGACHVSLDKKGKWAYVSHYGSGALSVFAIKENGELGDSIQTIVYEGKGLTRRQNAPHVHSSLVSPDNKYLYVADLGTDKLMIYTIDHSSGKLKPASMPWYSATPGAGPRHFTFSKNGGFIYLANELNGTVDVLKKNPADGSLESLQTISTLPEGFSEMNTVADIHTDPSGKFLYVTNRGHNSLAIFRISQDAKLELLAHEPILGNHPRNFMVDNKGSFVMVANQFTDNVPVFMLNEKTGLLNYSEQFLSIPAAVCLKMLELK